MDESTLGADDHNGLGGVDQGKDLIYKRLAESGGGNQGVVKILEALLDHNFLLWAAEVARANQFFQIITKGKFSQDFRFHKKRRVMIQIMIKFFLMGKGKWCEKKSKKRKRKKKKKKKESTCVAIGRGRSSEED